MSNEALSAVAKSTIRPSGRKFVAMALADYADERWTCFPSIGFLATYTSQSLRTVQSHLDDLEAAGIITRFRPRKPDGTLAGYRYTLHRQKLPMDDDQRKFSPVADFATGEKLQEPPAKVAAHNPQRLSPISSLRSDERAHDAAEFDAFWQEYPHKVGKPKARTSFAAARRCADLETILAGLRRYVASKPTDRQWLNPTTFLNQERWADEPAPSSVHPRTATPSRSKPVIDVLDSLIATMEEADARRIGQDPAN